MRAAARFGAEPIVARQPIEPELQHHLGGARWPATLALDIGQPFEEAAHIQQEPRKFRTNRIQRLPYPLARSNHCFGESRRLTSTAMAIGHRGAPARGGAWHQLGARELGSQPFSGLQLYRRNEEAAIASLTAGEPGKRALRLINYYRATGYTERALGKIEMLGAKRIDWRVHARSTLARKVRQAG
jgi:hypothetical protein